MYITEIHLTISTLRKYYIIYMIWPGAQITTERLEHIQSDYMQLNPLVLNLLVIGLTNRGLNISYIDALCVCVRLRGGTHNGFRIMCGNKLGIFAYLFICVGQPNLAATFFCCGGLQ